VLLWSTFCIHTEMLPVERVAADWGRLGGPGPLHCDKKWAKRSFPLENNLPEEGKFPCGYWNIYPFTHTVFIHSSVREKCSRPWAGTFYRSKKGKLPGVDFSHRYFRKIPAFRISQGHFRKIPAFPREECSRCPLPPWLILEKLTL